MKKLIAGLLCLTMLLSLCACGAKENPVAAETAGAAAEATDPAALYAQAAAGAQALKELSLDITVQLVRTLGVDTFTEETRQTLVLHDLGAETFSGSLYGYTNIGAAFIPVEQTYMNGRLYSRVVGDTFSAGISQEDFLSQFLPAVILDPAHYGSITLTDGNTIRFTQALQAEAWLPGISLKSAEGTAILDAEGKLKQSTYEAQYREGGSDAALTVTVAVSPEAEPAAIPEGAYAYREVKGWEAPLMLQKALGYLGQAASVSGMCQTTMAMNVFKMSYVSTENTAMFHDPSGFRFQFTNQSVLTDGDSGEIIPGSYEELYNDGVLRVTQDGESEEVPDVNETALESSVRESLAVEIPNTIKNMNSILVEETDETYLISYELNLGDALGRNMIEIFVNPDYVEEFSTDLSTTTCAGTLGIDKATGLPVGYSVNYVGTHTVEGEKNILAESVLGSLRLGGVGPYQQITGEVYPAETEEVQPLFYHVISPEGKEMWMLGTIHAGDGRTQNMAPEIYQAFEAADALAVEFDLNKAMEQMQENSEAAAAIAAQMMYLDGSTVADHLSDPQLLGKFMNLSTSNGTYNNNMLIMKPVALEQAVAQYFMEMGGRISTNYGVDLQLLNLAEKQEKPILNVESMESQMTMLMGLSDELQEKLLKQTLELGMDAYNAQLEELFDLWCQGDEAAIVEAIYTEEALDPQLQEYNETVLHERNVSMLETCESYLEGEDTVFLAVGLAHLIDPESGLVNALREAGCTVDLVSGTAA